MRTHFPKQISLTAGLLTLLASAAFAQTPPRKTVPLGLNVDTNEQTFVDLVQPTAARFDTAAASDDRGWAEGDFTFILDNRYTFGWVPGAVNVDPLRRSTNIGGPYRLTFRGQAALSGEGMTVGPQRYDAATNTTTATVMPGDAPGGVLAALHFNRTRRLPTDAPGTGVTDVHLTRPAPPGADPVFTALWLHSLTHLPWSALRFMGALGTNDYANPATPEVYPYRLNWATDRARPGIGPLYGHLHPGVHGMSWEQVIEAARATGKDIWINVPVNASDDYVRQLARLLKAGLPPRTHIYLEYSNELWHYGFFQGGWNFRAAQDEVAAGHTNLNGDGMADPDTLRFRRIAQRTVQTGQAFRAVFADDPQRIRPVINNAFVDHDVDMLTYVTKNYGPPGRFLYGIAQTGYYGSPDKSSVAAILAGERAASDGNRAGYVRSRTLATFFGLHSLVYEGGQDEEGNKQPATPPDPTLPNQFAAARAPGVAAVEAHDLLGNWYPSGGELYMQFAHVGRYSTYGMWGLSEDLADQTTGKWRGMAQTLAAAPPPATAGLALPTSPGKSVQQRENETQTAAYVGPGPAPWQMVLVRAAFAGAYTLTLSGTQGDAGSEERVMVDNHTAGTVSLPQWQKGTGASMPIALSLTPGLHAIFVYVDGPARITVLPTDALTLTLTGHR